MSHLKKRNHPQPTHNTEELLEDSDDDIEVVSKNDFSKVTLTKESSKTLSIDTDSEIVLDDSDSDIEEVGHVSSSKTTTLDENKVKSILSKVAHKNQTPASKQSSKLPPGLKISVSTTKTPSEGSASKTQPSTPRIVLQKVGSKWQNSSTPKSSNPRHKADPEPNQGTEDIKSDKSNSNSDDDFVPLKSKTAKSKQNKHSDDSVSDEDSNETIPKLNRSTRSTRSSVNTSRSDISQDVTLDTSIELDDEIQEELAKLEALQEILAKTNPNEKMRSNTLPKVKKFKSMKKNQSLPKTPKQAVAEKPKETLKLKPAIVPQIIDRGLIDCFDEVIVETTAGFPCNFCESKEIFKKRREMIYHIMQTKHEEELNEEQRNGDLSGLFPCEICKTAFYSKFILRTHKKAHMKSSEAGCDKYYQYYLRFGRI
jgi:hypothetical protein